MSDERKQKAENERIDKSIKDVLKELSDKFKR